MPEDRPKPGARRAAVTTTVETTVGAEEERVLRVLNRASVPEDRPLPQKDAGLPSEVQAKLRQIELEAFEQANRKAELEADLEHAEAEEDERRAIRDKIVARLREADAGEGDP